MSGVEAPRARAAGMPLTVSGADAPARKAGMPLTVSGVEAPRARAAGPD